jgi:hypothetical protein
MVKAASLLWIIAGMSSIVPLFAKDDMVEIADSWNIISQTKEHYLADEKSFESTRHWQPDKDDMMMPLNKLVAIARQRVNADHPHEKGAFQICAMQWWPLFSFENREGWTLRVDFQLIRKNDEESPAAKRTTKRATAYLLPNGDPISVRVQAMTDDELTRFNVKGEKAWDPAYIPADTAEARNPEWTKDHGPFPHVQDDAMVFGAGLQLDDPCFVVHTAHRVEYDRAKDLRADEDEMPVSMKNLVEIAKSRIAREPNDVRKLRTQGISWNRLGDDLHPAWVATVFIEIHFDYEGAAKQGFISPKDGDSYTSAHLFADGGEVLLSRRGLTKGELAKYGLESK